MKKISFIVAILLLVISLSGCSSIGYVQTSYNNQSFQGAKLGIPWQIYQDQNSNIIANMEFSFLGSSSKDNLNSSHIGIQYHRELFPDFGLYGGLGSDAYYYYPAIGRSYTITDGVLSYEGGLDIYKVFHIGYRSTSLNSRNIDMIFVEFGIPFNMGGGALWGG